MYFFLPCINAKKTVSTRTMSSASRSTVLLSELEFSVVEDDPSVICVTLAEPLAPGERVTLCDGVGFDYDGEIESIAGDSVAVRITGKRRNESEPALRVALYPGMPKADKLELVTQKATELGVSEICPVLTARSVSRPDAKAAAKKQERLLKAEGQADQGSAGLKQGAEKLKDKANEAASKITGNN